MSLYKIALPGAVHQLPEMSTTQVPIASGAGTITFANGIATVTTAGAHGLTFTPAAGVLPNYFVAFTGITGQAGVGTLVGPIFRILSIPSTTTFTIATTVTAATFTAGTVVPVFIPNLIANIGSVFGGGPTTGAAPGTPAIGPAQTSGQMNYLLGPNCTIQYNPDNTSVIQDSTSGNTLAVAPVFRILGAVSTGGQVWLDGTGAIAVFASGGAGTSRFSLIA